MEYLYNPKGASSNVLTHDCYGLRDLDRGAPKAMGTGRGSKVADRGSKVTDKGSPRKWITSDMVAGRASKAGRQVFNPKLVSEFNPIIGHVVPVKDKESDVVKDKESFVVKDKDMVLDDVVKDKESDVVKNVVNDVAKDVVSYVVLEKVVSNIKLSNVVSKKRTRRTEFPKLNAPAVADKHGVDVVSDNVADKTGVHQRFSGEVYDGPGEVVGFPTIVVVIPVIYGARMKRRWLLRFTGEGCGVSGEVFCVSGDGYCDSGEWVLEDRRDIFDFIYDWEEGYPPLD
ncbi:hypothetical protein Tco_1028903 [Tanacetum coccineum]|uniref:Uncharacterized protein n=1 Tax=Tanacetum coccineum TaxID=301880 RepID=A0ABQ5G1Y6_9ASTR